MCAVWSNTTMGFPIIASQESCSYVICHPICSVSNSQSSILEIRWQYMWFWWTGGFVDNYRPSVAVYSAWALTCFQSHLYNGDRGHNTELVRCNNWLTALMRGHSQDSCLLQLNDYQQWKGKYILYLRWVRPSRCNDEWFGRKGILICLKLN